MISTIFSIISLTLSKKTFVGNDLLSGIITIATPNRMAKNMICNIFLLLEALVIKLLGTRSIKGCKGPFSLVTLATSILVTVL